MSFRPRKRKYFLARSISKLPCFCFFFVVTCLVALFIFPYYISFYPASYEPFADMGAIGRWQQVYFLDNGTFSGDLESIYSDLKIEAEPERLYNFSIATEPDLALIYAIPKQQYAKRKILGINLGNNKNKPFYSYVYGVYIENVGSEKKPQLDVKTILCENNIPSFTKPNKPKLSEGTLTCGVGARKFEP